jgi:zinc/manganese transport system substrate-binding protein
MLPARPASLAALLAALAVVVGTAGCGSGSSASGPDGTARVKVVAAENFWGDIARQLGGNRVQVTSIISDPASDPHQYESDARDAAAVADARLVVVNGVGYDDFVSKLLSGTSHRGRVVLSVQKVLGATGSNTNPHLWYDVPRVPRVALAIESALIGADPAHRASYVANLKTFVASLAPLEHLLAQIRTDYSHAPVAYTERVPGYLLEAAGLRIATPSGFAAAIEDGNEPSAGDTTAMDDLVSGHRIRVLLYNAQATSPVTEHVRDLARRSGIPVVAVTETQPRDEPTYQAWQQHQLEALLTALKG